VSSYAPGILARGPWHTGQVAARWRDDRYETAAERAAAADRVMAPLEVRAWPAYDGLAARLTGYREEEEGLTVELQPMRWSLRLAGGDALGALSVLCVVRSADGRWLAGRRAAWVATWAGRWALGAGGALEVGEDPVLTLTRELHEEWGLEPERTQVEALVRLPNSLIMLIGSVWVATGVDVVRDHEHD